MRTAPEDYVVVESHRDHTELVRRRARGEARPLLDGLLPRLAEASYNIIVMPFGGDGAHHRDGSQRPLAGSLEIVDMFLNEAEASQGKAAVILTTKDLPSRPDDGVVRFLMEIEGTRPMQEDYSVGRWPIERRLHLVRMFHRLGVRSLHLTHQGRNELGDGLNELGSGGKLSKFGVALIREGFRLGMMMSLSHLIPECYYHAIEVAEGPLVATHSNAMTLLNHSRNLTDDQMKALAAINGVVGIHLWAPILHPDKDPLADVLDYIVYVAELIGAEHIGFGTLNRDPGYIESMGGGHREVITEPGGSDPVSIRRGLELFLEGLADRGFNEDEIAGIAGGNYVRVLQEVLPA